MKIIPKQTSKFSHVCMYVRVPHMHNVCVYVCMYTLMYMEAYSFKFCYGRKFAKVEIVYIPTHIHTYMQGYSFKAHNNSELAKIKSESNASCI